MYNKANSYTYRKHVQISNDKHNEFQFKSLAWLKLSIFTTDRY